MKVFMLYRGIGPLVILTSHEAVNDPRLVLRLQEKGIGKFMAYEIPEALARERYGRHFDVVRNDLHATDDLRVLDYDGLRAFKLFRFDELGAAVAFEGDQASRAA